MYNINKKLEQLKIIPVIALENAEDILPLGEIFVDNNLPVAEITFRSAAAEKAIRLLRQKYPEMLIIAGTVLNEQQIIAAKNAGADIIVAPGFNPSTIESCKKHEIPVIPGINSPSQIEQAMSLGVTTFKFFPAEASGGVKMLKSILAPYNQIKIMPTGGISPANIDDYLEIPAVLACGGSWMVTKDLIENKKWDEITLLIKNIVSQLN